MRAKPLILCDEVLVSACQRGTVLVPSQRLKRHVLHSFNAHQAQLGETVWPSARVEVLNDWLAGRYQWLAAQGHPAAARALLNENAQRLIWLAHPPDDAPTNLGGLYPLASNAWELLHAYQLEHRTHDLVDNENTRLLRAWITRFRAVANGRWLTVAELCRLISDAASALASDVTDPLLLVGFETLTPAQQALLDSLSTHGVRVERFAPATNGRAAPQQLRCSTAEAELGHAIVWARDLLLRAPDMPLAIGIALPNVVNRYDTIIRQLDATLSPHVIQEDPSTRAYNVSGGIVLADHPTVCAALGLLRWLIEPTPYHDVERLLASPFLSLSGALSGASPGAPSSPQSDALSGTSPANRTRIPAQLPESFTFASFANAVGRAPHRAVLELLSSAPQRATLAGWAEHFDGWLHAVQWPGPGSDDTTTFQAVHELNDALEELARLSPLGTRGTSADALALLDSLARQRLFAPKRPDAPLQIITHDEIDGLRFTHLWVTGLTDRDWPGQSRANPMLPLRLLREAGVPRCDAAAAYRYAREALERWHHLADEVVFSSACREGEEVLHATSLLPETAWSAHDTDPVNHPLLVPRGVALERYTDERGPPLHPQTLTSHSSSTLRDQAQCPFRAFAVARLGLTAADPPHSFPDARERGTAVHEALRLAYQQIADSDSLRGLSGRQQAALAEAAATTATDDCLARFPERVRALETARIAARLREWFAVDAARPDFEVVGTEVEIETETGTLPLKLRIDRIDRTEGGLLVLDYKTGHCNIRDWAPGALAEPQVPLYATLTKGVSGAAYASRAAQHSRLLGTSSNAQHYSNDALHMRPASDLDAGDWQELLAAWRIRLRGLADAFTAGDAAVQPLAKSTCEFCHLHALCRIEARDDPA